MALLGNLVGLLGMACFLCAYYLLQSGRWKPHGRPYLYTNLAGSLLLIISLMIDWNLAAFMLEAAWALISIYGIMKYAHPRNPQ